MKKNIFCLLMLTMMAAYGQKKEAAIVKPIANYCVSDEDAGDETNKFVKDKEFLSAQDTPAPPIVFAENDGNTINFPTPDGKTSTAIIWEAPEPTRNYLIVIHEEWGLNDYVKKMSQQLRNDLGNVNVIAVDLYDGKVAATAEEAGQMMRNMKQERGEAILRGLYTYEANATQFLTVGWCFGGSWSLQASILAGNKAGGCVMYYGMPEKDATKLKELQCDVLGIFANKDKWITPAVVDSFKTNMKAARKKLEVYQYDADYAFANPSQSDRYNEKATDDAYYYVKEFLAKHLDKE
jgi:carboxymethylenebutenolidase